MSIKFGIHAYNSKKYGPIIQIFKVRSDDKEDKTRKFLSDSEAERFIAQANHAKYSWYDSRKNTGQLILCPIDRNYQHWLDFINQQ